MKARLTFRIIDDNKDSLYSNEWEKDIDSDEWLEILSPTIYEDLGRIYDEVCELYVGWRASDKRNEPDIRVGRSDVSEFGANRMLALHTLLKKKCEHI